MLEFDLELEVVFEMWRSALFRIVCMEPRGLLKDLLLEMVLML